MARAGWRLAGGRKALLVLGLAATAFGALSGVCGLPGPTAEAQGQADEGFGVQPRGRVMVLGGGQSYPAPPEDYRSPHEGRVFGPSDSAAFIERKAAEILVEEVRRLQRFTAENLGDVPADGRREIIRKTAAKTLQGLRTRLDRADRERLLDWALLHEGVREGEAADRGKVLERIEPGPPRIPLARIPRLEELAEGDCPLAVRYPGTFDIVEETPQRKLKPRYEHFEVEKRTPESVVFLAPYAFRQKVPGPTPFDDSGIHPSDENAYERWKDPDTEIPPHPVVERLNGDPEERLVLLTPERAFGDPEVSATKPRNPPINFPDYL